MMSYRVYYFPYGFTTGGREQFTVAITGNDNNNVEARPGSLEARPYSKRT